MRCLLWRISGRRGWLMILVESSSHTIFGCKKAKKAWRQTSFDSLLATVRHLPTMEILLFFSSQVVLSPSPPPPYSFRRPVSDWLAPPPGRLKLNTAVAIRHHSQYVGLGATIRDDKGRVLVARSNQFRGSLSSNIGELIALREGPCVLMSAFVRVWEFLGSSPCINGLLLCAGVSLVGL
ncbi:hypothetical protein LWI28_023859 [Acer negundo]|uniref:RNase H type-1 domain-containing protein n=1 Tax=Acer negundo TaxID=4023 RepID=A0AAD5IFU7_ACENE|nr:hypothetical protein LWI28_023859 [Acer negundo]